MKDIIDINGIDILALAEQRETLKQISEMFNNDIINETSFNMDDRDWQKVTSQQHCDTSHANIKKSIKLLDNLITTITDELNKPEQINEANWDKD